jgi:hypothetical protein
MNFVMVRSDSIMSIDNETSIVSLAALAPNLEIVAFDTTTAKGNVEYNDRPRLLEPFADPTPYQPQINAWITNVAARSALPLTLTQAKLIKNGLVDGIFNFKRQQPITLGTNVWDATDSALAAMISALEAWDIVQDINSAFASTANEVNSMGITTYTFTNTSITYPGSVSGTYVTAVDFKNSQITTQSITAGGPDQQSASSSSASYSSHNNINVQSLHAPTIAWPPYNSTTTVTLSFGQMRALISQIGARGITYRNTQLTKKAAINALATIAAVVAYDATTGWPA